MHNVEGMAFAIPINDVRKIAKELEHKGKVNYPNTEIKIKMFKIYRNGAEKNIVWTQSSCTGH